MPPSQRHPKRDDFLRVLRGSAVKSNATQLQKILVTLFCAGQVTRQKAFCLRFVCG
jgi:hypothetical protein